MKGEDLANYIVPVIILLLYFFLGKKSKPKKAEEPSPQEPYYPPAPVVKVAPRPVKKSVTAPQVFEAKKIEPLQAQHNLAYKPKIMNKPSRGKALLKRHPKLKEAFILQEIFRNPYNSSGP